MAAPTFYNAKDQAIYDAGDKFMSQSKYLQDDYTPTEGISYAGDGSPVSYANSMGGIMTQAPIPAPLKYIPENGGDGGDGPPTGPAVDNSQFDYETEAYGLNDLSATEKGLTEEEQEDLDNVNNANVGLTGAMKAAFALNTLGPIAAMHSLSKSQKKAEEAAIEAATYGKAHRYDGRSNEYGTHTSTKTNKEAQANQDRGRSKGTNAGMSSAAKGAGMHGDGLAAMGGRAGTDFAKGGRVGYFFGGRVNYKAGGRIGFRGGGGQIGGTADMSGGSKSGTKDNNREQYGAVGQYSTGPTSTKNNDDGPKKTFFNNPKTLYDNTLIGSFPTGLTTTTPYGRLSAIMDLNKTLEEEDLEGKVQFDSSIGPVNTTTAYDTTIGPTFDASYTNGPVNIGYNNLDGINASYNKGPVSIGYNNGQATVNYSKSFAKGGRVSFKNGGLASIL